MPVSLRIETHRAMDPHRPVAIVLNQQLVEIDVLFYEFEVLLAHGETGQADVHRFARQVLGVAHAVYALIDRYGAEPAVDIYWPEDLP